MATLDLRAKVVDVLVNPDDLWSARFKVSNPDGTALVLTGYTISAPFTPVTGSPGTLNITGRDDAAGIFFFGQTEASWGTYKIVLTPSSGGARTYVTGTIGATS